MESNKANIENLEVSEIEKIFFSGNLDALECLFDFVNKHPDSEAAQFLVRVEKIGENALNIDWRKVAQSAFRSDIHGLVSQDEKR